MDRPKWVGEGPLAVALMWNIAVDKEPLRAEPPRLLTQQNNRFHLPKEIQNLSLAVGRVTTSFMPKNRRKLQRFYDACFQKRSVNTRQIQ